MLTCPHCKGSTSITLTKGPGRYLSGYALSPVGAMLEIPEDIEIPVCSCGVRLIDEALGETLRAFESSKTRTYAPIEIL